MRERIIRKEAVVNGSLKAVWDTWTTSKGVEVFFAPRANIKLGIGGPYELFFDRDALRGSRGSEA